MAATRPGSGGGWRGLDGRQRRVLGSTLTANALVFFDQTAVVVALPYIGREFGAGAADLQWVVTAYLLALAVFMLAGGRVADRIGLRRTFFAGLATFAVGSLLCAVAPSLPVLIAARFLQGIGGAIVQPLALAITTRAVSESQRGWAIGALATGGTSFLVFGPLIGGFLLIADWRWIFVVSLPVAATSVLLGRNAMRRAKEPEPRPVPWGSIPLLLAGLTLVVFGLVSGAELGAFSVVPAVAGLGVLALFVVHESRVQNPLIDVRLLSSPMLTTALIALFAIQFSVFGVTVYLALYLHHRLGLGGVAAGAVIAIAGLGTPLLSQPAGRLADRFGPRRLVLPALILAALGLVLLAVLAPLGGVLILLPGLVIFAASRPGVFTPAGTGPFLALSAEQRGFAASLATEARQLGAVFGVAVTTAIGIAVHGASLLDAGPALGDGLRVTTLVSAAVCALAAATVWRWMPHAAPVGSGSRA